MTISPFRIRVYDKDHVSKFVLSDPQSVSVTQRYRGMGSASIALDIQHHRVTEMLKPGTRVTIDYLIRPETPTAGNAWLRLMSGPCWDREINGPTTQGQVLVTIEDDIRLLGGLLARPVPGALLSNQTASEFDIRTGNGESVIKAYLAANANRSLKTITIATNQNRGTTITGNLRMALMEDGLLPLADLAGLGMTLVQNTSGGFTFDVYAPADKTGRVLSEASGTITNWSFNGTGPTVTRTTVGDGGEGTDRSFIEVTDTVLEALWGVRIESFTDGKDVEEDDDPTLIQQGQATLLDGRPTAGFSVTMAETDVVRYGRTHVVGDKVKVQITDELVIEDILTESTISWDADQGLEIAPVIGTSNNNTANDVLAQAVNRIAAGQRNQRSR